MRKEMLEVSVYTEGAEIIIEQPNPYDGDERIALLPEQIDILIAWLQEAKGAVAGKNG